MSVGSVRRGYTRAVRTFACGSKRRGCPQRAPARRLATHTAVALALVVGAAGNAQAFPFLEPPEIVPGSLGGAPTVAVLDYDDDGFLDIAAMDYHRTVTLRFGTATGFTTPDTLDLGGGGNTPALLAADVTGDGYEDLLAIAGHDPSLMLIRGRADGVLAAPAAVDVHGIGDPGLLASGAPSAVDVADLDGDGDLDVVAAVGSPSDAGTPANTLETGTAWIFVNDGSGGLAASATTLAVNAPRDVLLVALSGDDDPDLVVAQANREASTTLKIFPGGTGATFGAPAYAPAGAPATELDWGDFNDDARVDLVVAHGPVGNHALQPASVLPGISAPATLGAAVSAPAADGTHVIGADLDRDGRDDLYVSDGRLGGSAADNPIFLRGLGGLQFGPRDQDPTDDDPRYESRPQLADIDGDGKPDAVTAGWNGLPPDRIFIRFGAGPQLLPTPSDGIDFGFVPLFQTVAPEAVVFTNTGPGTASGVTREDDGDLADFPVSGDTCSGATLAVGQACTVGFGFTPTAEGDRFALVGAAAVDSEYVFPAGLLGTGVEPSPAPPSPDPPPAPAPPPPPPPPPAAVPPPAATPTAMVSKPRFTSPTRRGLLRRGLTFSQRLPSAGRVSWSLRLPSTGIVIGRATRTLKRPGSVRVVLKLSRVGARQFTRRRATKLALRTSFKPAGKTRASVTSATVRVKR